MIEPGILFFVNAFVFDRGLHGYWDLRYESNRPTSRSREPKKSVSDSRFYVLD